MTGEFISVASHVDPKFEGDIGWLRVLVTHRLLKNHYPDGNWQSRFKEPYFWHIESRSLVKPLKPEADRIAQEIISSGQTHSFVAAIEESSKNNAQFSRF